MTGANTEQPFKESHLDPTKQYKIEILDQRIINMVQEIPAHPKLYARMQEAERQGAIAASTIFETGHEKDIELIQNFEQAIGFLAAEVGLLMDGLYNYEAICNLCEIITQRLVDRRTTYVNSSPIVLPGQ